MDPAVRIYCGEACDAMTTNTMTNFIKKHIGIVLFVIALIPMIGFLPNGLPVTHDGQDHVARIANFYQSLREGNIVPRWASQLNWGYGHPILMFLYPLPSYMASLFHALGASFVDSTKLVFVVSYIVSGLAMYLWMKEAFGKRAGVIGAILYLFAPYRFIDLYVRGAIGEHVAFMFPPLILFFLYKLAKEQKKVVYGIGLSICVASFLLSHNAISIMFLPVFGLYALYLFFTETKKSMMFLLSSICYVLLGIGLSSFFLLPAFFEGKYTLRDIVTANEAMQRFVPPMMFLYSPWNYGGGNDISKMIGFGQWAGLAATLVLFVQTKAKNLKILLGGFTILFIGSLFVMTAWSKMIWETITLLQKFQFPWRFLSLSTFFAAALGGIAIATISRKSKTIGTMTVLVFCVLTIFSTMHMWRPKAYQQKAEDFYTGVYLSTTDTGESSPIWSTRFMEFVYDKPMKVIDGEAVIQETVRTTTTHGYNVAATKPTRLVENTVYFPGWTVYVDGIKANVEFQDQNHRGLITFYVPAGAHAIRIQFIDTKLRMVSNMVSLVSIVGLIGGGMVLFVWRKKS